MYRVLDRRVQIERRFLNREVRCHNRVAIASKIRQVRFRHVAPMSIKLSNDYMAIDSVEHKHCTLNGQST